MKQRYNKIMELQQKISKERNESFIGKTIPCIIESYSDNGEIVARSQYDAPEIDGVVTIKSNAIVTPGDIEMVKITGVTEYDLIGEITKDTGLTRKTVIDILIKITPEKFKYYQYNPEEFIRKVCNLINQEKATTIIDGITYHKTDNRFDNDIFTINNVRGELGENAIDVKKHIDDIKNKYIIPGVTSNQAFMFLPAEALFAELNAYHQDIIEYAYKNRVWITSPTTLMSMLTVVETVVKNMERDKYAMIIQKELQALSIEFARYKERWESLQKSIDKVSKDVKDVNVTTEKITNKFQSINRVEVDKFITTKDE